ncbi:hypothetical protein Tco_1394955 [Tanacetum coccineum]
MGVLTQRAPKALGIRWDEAYGSEGAAAALGGRVRVPGGGSGGRHVRSSAPGVGGERSRQLVGAPEIWGWGHSLMERMGVLQAEGGGAFVASRLRRLGVGDCVQARVIGRWAVNVYCARLDGGASGQPRGELGGAWIHDDDESSRL